MNRRHLSLTASVILCSAAAQGAEVYVRAAAGSGDGTPQSPFGSVQAAINAAATGDTIRIAAGTYVENLRIEGKAITLEGGYSSAWTRDTTQNSTVLRGAGGNAVITLLASDSTIDGLLITGGTGSTEELPYGYHGGGIYSRDGSPTITNNIIEGNDVRSGEPPYEYFFGGGIYVSNAPAATITNNVIRANFAGRGAGIAVVGPAAVIRGNRIENNVAVGDHGGGLFLATTRATVTQNQFLENEIGRALGYGWGGGMIVVGAGNSAELSYNVLRGNFAAAYGAATFVDEGATASMHHELIYGNVSQDGCEAVSAIAVDGGEGGGSQVTIDHCTVTGNICTSVIRGNGLQVEGQSVVRVSNSIFWNNGGDDFAVDNTSTLAVTFTDSQEPIAGAGNISADPLFVDAGKADFRLAAGSPCIDAADPTAPFDAEPAPNGGRADMGRFGNPTESSSPPPLSDSGTGGGSTGAGGSSDSDAGSADSGGGSDTGDDSADNNAGGAGDTPASGAAENIDASAACPMSTALLLSMSLLGVRRTRARD